MNEELQMWLWTYVYLYLSTLYMFGVSLDILLIFVFFFSVVFASGILHHTYKLIVMCIFFLVSLSLFALLVFVLFHLTFIRFFSVFFFAHALYSFMHVICFEIFNLSLPQPFAQSFSSLHTDSFGERSMNGFQIIYWLLACKCVELEMPNIYFTIIWSFNPSNFFEFHWARIFFLQF